MTEEVRIVTPSVVLEEEKLDRALRPKSFDEFVGQRKVVENLQLSIEACRRRTDGSALDHVLLSGPPGLGKTTLASIIASELGVTLHSTSGPVIEKAADLAGLLTALQPRDMLFIDEIHRLPKTVEEFLYAAMEDYVIDIMLDKGAAARSIKLSIPPFTLVGATTRAGMIAAPMRERFGITHRLDHYGLEDMTRIVERAARLLKLTAEPDGIREVAGRSRGTPRISNRLLRRCRDYAEVKAGGVLTRDAARKSLDMLDVDPLGLDAMDRRILEAIIEKFDGGPVGADSLAVAVGEEPGTIEEVYEPYLIAIGMIKRTPRGRVALARAMDYVRDLERARS